MEFSFSDKKKRLIVLGITVSLLIVLLFLCFRLYPDGGGGNSYEIDDYFSELHLENSAEDLLAIPSELGGFTVESTHISSTYVEKLELTIKGKLTRGKAIVHMVNEDNEEVFRMEIEKDKDYSNENFIIRDVGYTYTVYVDYSKEARSNLSIMGDEYAYGYQKIISLFHQ